MKSNRGPAKFQPFRRAFLSAPQRTNLNSRESSRSVPKPVRILAAFPPSIRRIRLVRRRKSLKKLPPAANRRSARRATPCRSRGLGSMHPCNRRCRAHPWHQGFARASSPTRVRSQKIGSRASLALPLLSGAPVHGSSNVPRMTFGILGRREDGHPTLPVSELAIDHTPRMSTRTRFPHGPALRFRVFQRLSNVLVRMFGHNSVFLPLRYSPTTILPFRVDLVKAANVLCMGTHAAFPPNRNHRAVSCVVEGGERRERSTGP